MTGTLWAISAATVLLAGGVSFAMTRRYGLGAALSVPLLALVAVIAMQWQNEGLGVDDGLRLVRSALVFSAPILLGTVAGIAIARLRRG